MRAIKLKKFLASLCIVALLASQTQAANFNVTNTNDSGAGSLPFEIPLANTAGDTITWSGASSGGTIDLSNIGSTLPAIASGVTLNVSNAPSSVQITGTALSGTPIAMPLNGNVIFDNNSIANPWTISTQITNNGATVGSINKTGLGLLQLTSTNTYTGGTTITAGTLQAGGGNVFGTGGVTVQASALLDLNGFSQNIGTLTTVSGSTVAVTAGTNITVGNNGSITEAGEMLGSGTLTKTGTGTLNLTGNNTNMNYIVNGGVISVSGSGVLGSGDVSMGSGTGLNLNGTNQSIASLSGGGTVNLGGSGSEVLTIGSDGNSTTYAGTIAGSGAIAKVGAGTLSLTGNNTYAAGTSLTGGTLNVGSNTALGSGALAMSNATTLQFGSSVALGNSVTLNGGNYTFDTQTFNGTLSGVISESAKSTLLKTGSGMLTLSHANTYTGGNDVFDGILQAGVNGAFGSGAVFLSNATGVALDLNGTNQSIGSLSGGGFFGGNVTLGGGTLTTGSDGTATTFSGSISGAGGITKIGNSTFTLNGANASYTGTTTLNAGELVINNSTALGTGTLAMVGTSILQFGAGFSLGNNVTFNTTASTYTINAQNFNSTLAGQLTGAGGFTKIGSGTLTLSGNNSYAGGTLLDFGTLNVSSGTALGIGPLIMGNNTTLQFGANEALTIPSVIILSSATNTFDTQAFNATTFASIQDSSFGVSTMTKIGTGMLTLSGLGTYSGGNIVNGGILQAGHTNAFGTGAVVLANTAGVGLDLNGFSQTIGSLSGGGTTGGNVTLGNLSSANLTIGTDNTSTTYSGIISGAGQITKTGTGTLTLTGANTYSGGTTLSTGTVNVMSNTALGTGLITMNTTSTLQFGADLSMANNMTFNATSSTFTVDTQNFDSTLSGQLSGAGTLTKIGSGTLSLSGNNGGYIGGINVNAGTLNVSSDTALGIGQIVLNSGTLVAASGNIGNSIVLGGGGGTFNGVNTTLSGIISGAGNLTLTTSSKIILAGANTYTGNTILLAGTLGIAGTENLAGDSPLGGPNAGIYGTLDMNGGNLRFLTNSIIPNPISLNAPTNTFDSGVYISTFTGQISGTGNLTKAGTGILYLTNTTNNYTGGTTVNNGTLALGASNAVSTAGDLTVNTGGTFDMGTLTQNLATFNAHGSGGTLKLQLPTLPGPNTPGLVIAGNANLANSILSPTLAPQIVTNGERFNAVSYVSHTGQFANILPLAAIGFTGDYTTIPGVLVLVASPIPFPNIASTPNQVSVATILEPLRTTATGDLATVIGQINTLTAPQIQAAFDQIGPISLAAMGGLGMAGSNVQSAALGRRVTTLASAGGSGYSSYQVTGRSPAGPSDLFASAGMDDTIFVDESDVKPSSRRYQSSSSNPSSNESSPWGFYTSGVATLGRLQGLNTGSGLQPGYYFDTGGMTGGGDYRFTDNLAAGISAGYLHSHASIDSPGSGTVDNNSARYGIYTTVFDQKWRANLYLGGAADFFNTNRGVAFGTLSRNATATPYGNEFNAEATGSYDFPLEDFMILSPFFGLNYDRLMIDPFSETGADSMDLNVGSQLDQSFRSSLGLRLAQRFEAYNYIWMPYANLGWRHEFLNQAHPIDAQLASGTTSVFSVSTADMPRDGALVGAGLLVKFNSYLMLKLDYAGDFRSHFSENDFNADLRFHF